MEISRNSKISLTILITAIFAVRCQASLKDMPTGAKINDNAGFSSLRLTKRKAKELAASPSALIHEALHLVRRRRSVEYNHDDQRQPSGNLRNKIATLVNRRRLDENSSGEERKHLIDKRQIPDGLSLLNDYMEGGAVPVSVRNTHRGPPAEEKAYRRVKKDVHSSNGVITMSKKSEGIKPLELNSMSLEEIIKRMAPILKGKDGRDGKDGKDGRDGRDGVRGDPGYPGPPGPSAGSKACSEQTEPTDMRGSIASSQQIEEKPSGHLTIDGGAFRFTDGLQFSQWCATCPSSHLAGGMTSSNSSLYIPRDGRYFIYCQLHLLQTDAERTGFEILVNGTIVLSKIVKGEEATYSGAVFIVQRSSAVSVRLMGKGTVEGDHTVNFLGAYQI